MDRNQQRIWIALACLGMTLLSSCKFDPTESDPSSASSGTESSYSSESSSVSLDDEVSQQEEASESKSTEESQDPEMATTTREAGDLLSLIIPSAQHASISEKVTLDGRNSLFDPYRVAISLDEVEAGRAAEDFLKSEGIEAPALDRRYEYVVAQMTISVEEVYDESKQAKIQTFDFELLDPDSHPYPPILNVSDERFGIDGLAEGEECKLRLIFQKLVDDRTVRLVYLSRVSGGVHFEYELPKVEASEEDEDIFDHDWN